MHTIPKLKPEFELTPTQKKEKKRIWNKLLFLRRGLDKLGSVGKARCQVKIDRLLEKSIRLGLHVD